MRSLPTLSRAYLCSGWAFLIPYLGAYLLYAWSGWPVNPAAVSGLSDEVSGQVPSLLYVYWLLHAFHLLLGGALLAVTFSRRRANRRTENAASPPAIPTLSRVLGAIPWLGLGLLFWIPGVYLEWPADTWEHLRRINEWHAYDLVIQHSAWVKSSYFLSYSLLGLSAGIQQLLWLDLYYTGICLLLSWQYYRLARAVGLGEGPAMVFVLLQALLIGNNVFSFYRYYGISSSIYAQLGAVVLLRLAIELFRAGRAGRHRWLATLFCAAMALALALFNHPQAAGLAALGICGVALWKLFAIRRRTGWVVVVLLIAISLLPVAWYPSGRIFERQPTLQEWISPWIGFKVFVPDSPAADRLLQILGLAGVINAIAAIWLLRKNHLVGWVTLAPILLLCLPYVALPLAEVLLPRTNIVTFQRMYLAIPPGLALVCCFERLLRADTRVSALVGQGRLGFLSTLAALLILVAVSPGRPTYNHSWNALSSVPRDLAMEGLIRAYDSAGSGAAPTSRPAGTPAAISVLQTFHPEHAATHYRPVIPPVTGSLQAIMGIPATTGPSQQFQGPSLSTDYRMTDQSAWRTTAGAPPKFVSHVPDLKGVTTALQTVVGETTEIFSEMLVPIDPSKNYRVEMSLKQELGKNGQALLAVAWYDQEGRFLNSGEARPIGAAAPAGWRNGTYSYFGPVGLPVPEQWTTHRLSFGADEFASIPLNARAVRIGALLNYPATPGSVMSLANVRLWEKSLAEQMVDGAFTGAETWLVVAPDFREIYTRESQAARLSRHWSPHRVPYDYAGGPELEEAALRQQAIILRPGGASFYFYPAEKTGNISP